MNRISVFALFVVSLLSGCDSAIGGDGRVGVRQNSYPLIVDTVSQLVPQLGGTKNGDLLNEICSVVYGVKSQAELGSWLKNNFTDAEILSEENVHYNVLTGKDKVAQRTTCAAWLSLTINDIPNVDNFATKDKDGKLYNVDEKAVVSLMPLKLAVARTNAEIFAAIATKLDDKKPLSYQVAKERISALFEESVPRYLASVKAYTAQENSRVFQLILLQKGRFVFQDSGGYLFDVSSENINLFWHSVPWLSKGKLQGKDYFISIAAENP